MPLFSLLLFCRKWLVVTNFAAGHNAKPEKLLRQSKQAGGAESKRYGGLGIADIIIFVLSKQDPETQICNTRPVKLFHFKFFFPNFI